MFGELTVQLDRISALATGTRQVQRSRINLQELPRFHAAILPQLIPNREQFRLALGFDVTARGQRKQGGPRSALGLGLTSEHHAPGGTAMRS